MRVTDTVLRRKVDQVNETLGFRPADGLPRTTPAGWSSEVGSLALYHDIAGYAVHQIVNPGRGVHNVSGYGLTAREAYAYLRGVIDAPRIARTAAELGA